MRWTPGSDRGNLEDRRGQSMGAGGGGGALVGLLASIVGRKFGIVGVLIVLVVGALFSGGMFGGGGGSTTTSGGEVARGASAPVQQSAAEAQLVDFVTYVLNDAQDNWEEILPRAAGTPYRDARLVLYRDAVQTGCGNAPSAVGPFYCPNDERVYIDLSFYEELQRKYGAPGDFAQAYVLAHEIGHHVQHVVGTDARVRQLQQSRPEAANPLSVRMELQADCYAGVWAYSVKGEGKLDPGDAEEALAAASAVGDDRLQQRARGQVNPDSFTHGTAQQRSQWFQRGFQSGDPRSCDTFSGGV
ncbi:KPN_02809 family neutral zinc metallopeptidase [Roseisolibacter agri]|uniref:Neutral zinc metallopeptidase n=1 Tax=Roseisolibacter agri TaxID=2014610 RepID=A0AA37QG65_9BACT|nr:neutral zinc metallopeptidase [Roseisolibacter agri]GLC25815.1 hypothetical protein rosag_23280 [Roseisolibacter agri]